MDYNDHSRLRGLHAFLSPSSYHWLHYDKQKLRARFTSHKAAQRGSDIHAWAHEGIRLGMRQKENGATVNKYINDGIRYRMKTDFMVFYSENAFGEADCLSYSEKEKTLRINDLKTGLTKAGITQLELYAAYFCLEYGLDPEDLIIILQIYQNDTIIGGLANPAKIRMIMDRTIEADLEIKALRKEIE